MPVVIQAQNTEVMTWKECQYLLGTKVGEIGFFSFVDTSQKPLVCPVTFALFDGNLYLACCDPLAVEATRQGSQGSLGVVSKNPSGSHLSWSVVAQGNSQVLDKPDISDWSGAKLADVLDVSSGASVIRLTLDSLTGFRYVTPSVEDDVLASPSQTMAATITSI